MQRYGFKIGQYIDDLVSEEAFKRVDACEHLPETWKALGRQRTKTQLIPFLQGISEGSEEFLCALAKCIRGLVLFVGTDQVNLVLNIVFNLYTSEDSSVREEMTLSLDQICKDCYLRDEDLISLARRLSEHIRYSAHVSAVVILGRLSKYISHTRMKEVFSILRCLAESEDAPVRVALASNLKYIMRNWQSSLTDCLELLADLAEDKLDCVRVCCPESVMFEIVEPRVFTQYIWPNLKKLLEDPSWKVRSTCMQYLREICQSAGKNCISKLVLPYYIKALADKEIEVCPSYSDQKSRCGQPEENFRVLGARRNTGANSTKTEVDIEARRQLPEEYSTFTIAAADEAILSLAPALSKGDYPKEDFFAIYNKMLSADELDVTMQLLNTLRDLKSIKTIDSIKNDIYPVLENARQDNKNWKNREKVIECILNFEKELGQDFINDPRILKLLTDSLSDRAFAVRQKAISCIQKLAERLGGRWAEKYVLPKLMSFMSHMNYLYRQNALFGVKGLVKVLSHESLAKAGAQFLELSTVEKIPSVMVLLLQTIEAIGQALQDSNFDDNSRIMYNTFLNDPDSDVSYYAKLYSSAK